MNRQPDDPGLKHVSLFDAAMAQRDRLKSMTRQRDAWRVIAAVGWGFAMIGVFWRLLEQ